MIIKMTLKYKSSMFIYLFQSTIIIKTDINYNEYNIYIYNE